MPIPLILFVLKLIGPAVILAITKKIMPEIPKVALPVLAPALGIALDYMGSASGLGLAASGPLAGALMGAASVGLREIYDQVKKIMVSPRPPITEAYQAGK